MIDILRQEETITVVEETLHEAGGLVDDWIAFAMENFNDECGRLEITIKHIEEV